MRAINFLLRRIDGKQFILNHLKAYLKQEESLSTLGQIFDLITQQMPTSPDNKVDANEASTFRKPRPKTDRGAPKSEDMMSSKRFTSELDPKQLRFIFEIQAISQNKSDQESSLFLNDSGIRPANVNDSLKMLSSDLALISGLAALKKAESELPTRNEKGLLVIDQIDISTHVLSSLDEENGLDCNYFVSVVLEYMRSLEERGIIVKHFVYELLVQLLVRKSDFYQLHQLLQFNVICDSFPVACQLLSLEKEYPPAFQVALDMLKRLCSPSQIIEVLLSRGQVLAALRVSRAQKDVQISSNRYLEAARIQADPVLYYTVFKYLEQRRELAGESAEKYVAHFNQLFPS
eukprot:TRINITY_DN13366_c0_g1_i1.p1 TRINITY_DN13366_c0_g1~~TRINITY_DN13366_c0_g1_i1.p1  ORF type:complete len:347 (-),score=91.18 TRINITY_DN13366_c0_g1_i1:7-1047(-)